jgi:hypothetical protein
LQERQKLKCKITKQNSKIILHFALSFLYLTFDLVSPFKDAARIDCWITL